MPYQSLGSYMGSQSVRGLVSRDDEIPTYLGVPQVDQSILIGGICLLKVVHHQVAVSLYKC